MNMWLHEEIGKLAKEKWNRVFIDTPDYQQGYTDAVQGISRREALELYGNLSIRYYMGHRQALTDREKRKAE